MAFHPVFHGVCESLRFGRVLFVEIAPGPPAGRPCRYCDALWASAPARSHFSVPDAAARVILSELDRGVSCDAVVLGGPGDPLRHGGAGTLLRKLRTASHVPTILLTDGVLLRDREARRDAAEASQVVAWLPARVDRRDAHDPRDRADAFEHHVEGIATLGRESQVGIVLELPLVPGTNDGEDSLAAWKRAAERTRADRAFVIPAPGVDESGIAAALESARLAIHRRAGAFLLDGTPVDERCWCQPAE
jgi:pyruvate-formate lyase-activating enzyme